MSLVVSISIQADAISNGDQCLCLMRYPSNFDVVLVLAWFDGLETRAQYATRSWMFSNPMIPGSPECMCRTGCEYEMRRARIIFLVLGISCNFFSLIYS